MWGILAGFFDILQIIVVLLAVAGLILFLLFVRQFKHKVRIKEVINGRKVIFDDKAREFKASDGGLYWQLYRKKDKIPVPPGEAIELDTKGRKCVEAYRTQTGEYVFAKDVATIKDPPERIFKIKDGEKREAELEKWRKENNVIAAFQPLTTKHRVILIGQIRKAEAKKKRRWQEMLLPIAGLAALVIIAVSLMIFYDDMAKPLLKMGDKYNANAAMRTEQLTLLKEIKQNIQVIRAEETGTAKTEPPN